jgi:thymidylate kinase
MTKRGMLIAGEGPDGAGKTTLLRGLAKRLRTPRDQVVVSNWNDTVEIYNLMMALNAAGDLTNDMRCTFGAVELAARYHYVIRPALHRGETVLACKYLVSARAHAQIRGHDEAFLDRLYGFAFDADLTLYVDVPPDICLERKLRTGRIGFWEAGLDLSLGLPLEDALRAYAAGSLSPDVISVSFLDFQTRLGALHRQLLSERRSTILDGTLPAQQLQEAALASVEDLAAKAPDCSGATRRAER